MLDQGGLHVMGIDRPAGARGRLRLHHGSAGQDESQEPDHAKIAQVVAVEALFHIRSRAPMQKFTGVPAKKDGAEAAA